MAISDGTAGAWVATTTRNPTVTLPTHAAGDMLLVRMGWKSATPTTDVAVCNTSGWAKLGQYYNGGGASSNGGGGVLVAVFWKVATSSSETNPVIEFDDATGPTPGAYSAVTYAKGSTETWETPVGDGGAIAAATSYSGTIQSHISAASGDMLDAFAVTNDNTTLTVPTVTQAGLTLDTVTEYPATALSSATSNDISADGSNRLATAGTSSAAAVVSGTNSVADPGAAWCTRLRLSNTQTLTVPLLDAGAALYEPTVVKTLQDLVVPLLDAGNALYVPTVTVPVFANDDFSDAQTDNWGSADTGGEWTESTPADFDKVSGEGIIAFPSVVGTRTGTLEGVNVADHQGSLDWRIAWTPTGTGYLSYNRIQVRSQNSHADGYVFYIQNNADDTIDVTVRRRSSSSDTTIATWTDLVTGFTSDTWYTFKWQVENSGSNVILRGKLWLTSGSEPGTWNEYTDTAPGSTWQNPGSFRLIPQLLGAYTGSFPVYYKYDNLVGEVIPSASGPQTLTLPLLDASNALYAPTVSPDQFLTVPLLDASNALYAPTIAQAQFLTVPLLDAVSDLYAPTLTPKSTLIVPLLDASNALYVPTLTGKNTLIVPLLDSSPALYAPTVLPTNTLTVPLLDASSALYVPTLVLAPYPLIVPLLDSGSALYEPTVTKVGAAPQDLTVPFLDAVSDLYAPTLLNVNTLAVPLLDAVNALYPPTAIIDQFLTVPLLDAGAALYVPTITPKNILTVPLLESTPALYVPTLTFYNTLTVPLLDSGPTLYVPTVVRLGGDPQNLTVPFLESTPALYVPTITFYNTLTVPLLDAVNALYPPTAIQDQWLDVPLLDAVAALYVPTITTGNSLTVPFLQSTPALYAPSLKQISLIVLPLLDAVNALYPPVLGQTAALTVPLLDAVNNLYPPSLEQGYPVGWVYRIHDVAYHLMVYEPTGTGGPGVPKLDLTPDLLNVVWQAGLNLPEMVAFTLARENPKIAKINWMVDHFKLFREDSVTTTVLMAGKLVKPQFTASDVVILGWDYKAFLQLSRTGYNTEYPLKKLGTEIVSLEWSAAKTAATSPLEFVATGTIEDPLALDTVTPITTNDDFGVVLFNRLYTFFQIAEMGMANTANTVVFEITRTAPHTFHFWKNKGQDSGLVLTSPGNVASHDFSPSYESIRNDRATVLLNEATSTDEAYVVSDSTSITAYRRLQDAVTIRTLMGLSTTATEEDQQKEAMARLLKEGIRLPKTVTIWPRQGDVAPFRNLSLADLIRVKLRDDASGALYDGNLRIIQMAGGWSPNAGEVLQLSGRGMD